MTEEFLYVLEIIFDNSDTNFVAGVFTSYDLAVEHAQKAERDSGCLAAEISAFTPDKMYYHLF